MIRLNAHRIFAAASAAAAVLHIVSVLAGGFLTPDYLQSRRAISDLGIAGQPYAFLINYLGFAVPGAFILLAALAANKMQTFPIMPRLGLLCMACAGISLIVAGLYPFPSLVHLTAALLVGISASASILGLSVYAWKPMGSSILVVSGFTVALFMLTDIATWFLAETQNIRIHAFMGLQQRLASFSAFLWFSAFAVAAARRPNQRISAKYP